MTMTPEHPAAQLARMFNMGKYGENLAKEILERYRLLLINALEEQGQPTAAGELGCIYLEDTFELDRD